MKLRWSSVFRMPRGSKCLLVAMYTIPVWAVQKTCSTSSEVNLADIVYGQVKREVDPHEARGDGVYNLCSSSCITLSASDHKWVMNKDRARAKMIKYKDSDWTPLSVVKPDLWSSESNRDLTRVKF